MKYWALIFLLVSGPTWAQKQISSQAFQANVRPVLSGILNDFYQMMTLFPDFPKELMVLVDQMDSLTLDKEDLRLKCPRVLAKPCLENITSLRNKLSLIQAKTLELFSGQKMSPTLHLNSLAGLRLINEFHMGLEEVKGQLDNSEFMIKAQVSHKRDTYQILKSLDELNTYLSLSVVEYVPYLYKEEFRHFYFNFVHPIQQQISKNQNYEFLNRNVNSLNFAINLLNMNLTKRNKKTPEGMAPFLSLIHNRWNSLLRYYF